MRTSHLATTLTLATAGAVLFAPSAFACEHTVAAQPWAAPVLASYDTTTCALADQIGLAAPYNEFALGDADRGKPVGVDDQGAAAYGGNAHFTHFYVGQDTGTSVTPGLVVGGIASGTVATLSGATGVVGVGSTITDPATGVAPTTVRQGPSPIDFTTAAHQLDAASTHGAALPANGTATLTGDDLRLTGTDAKLDTFRLPTGTFAQAQHIDIDVPPTATVVVVVPDTTVADTTLNYLDYNGETAGQYNSSALDALRQHTVFDFPSATSLSFTAAQIGTNILAPHARFTFTNGQLDGAVWARSINGDFQTDEVGPFGGCTPPPPLCPLQQAIGAAWQYNEFATGDAVRSSDDEGAVAYGGRATFSNFYVGEFTGSSVTPGLVVGKAATGTVGPLSGTTGVVGAGSSIAFPHTLAPVAGVTVGASPIDFAAAGAALAKGASLLATLPANGTATLTGGDLVLHGTSGIYDVFQLPVGTFAQAQHIDIDVPSSATVIVVVPDSSVTDTTLNYIAYNGETAGNYNSADLDTLRNHTVIDFPHATSLSFTAAQLGANVLAPHAVFQFDNGQTDGAVWAKSIRGDFQGNDVGPFGGCAH